MHKQEIVVSEINLSFKNIFELTCLFFLASAVLSLALTIIGFAIALLSAIALAV